MLPQTTVSLALPPACAAVEALLLFFHCLFSLRLLLPFRLMLVWRLKLLLVRFLAWQLKWLCRFELFLQLSLFLLLDDDWILLANGLVYFYSFAPEPPTTAIELALDTNMTVICAFNYKMCQFFNVSIFQLCVNFSTVCQFFNLPYS